jgi:hypothetical protein
VSCSSLSSPLFSLPHPRPLQLAARFAPRSPLRGSLTPAVSYIGAEVDRTPLLPYLDPAAPPTSFSLPTDARSQMYGYMLQEGIEQQLLLEGEGISPASFRIAAGVGSGKFALPPTYIVHGT